MDSIGYGKSMRTKWSTWKAKIDNLTQKVARRESQINEIGLGNSQDLDMPITKIPSRIAPLENEWQTERITPGKFVDNFFVANPGKYMLRSRITWTGLYGKEPWPRERKRWERI